MNIKSIKCCPFLKGKRTFELDGVVTEEEYFSPCVKENCPSFYCTRDGYGDKIEKCKRCIS
jgi:hypothetical protein